MPNQCIRYVHSCLDVATIVSTNNTSLTSVIRKSSANQRLDMMWENIQEPVTQMHSCAEW